MSLTFHLILHTHWDREWYLPQGGFQPRLIAAFGDVLDLLERDPAATFVLDGQSVLAEDVLDTQPEWIGRATRAVRAGQLAVGPWYVLADELVPSGESMLRNLLQGSRDANALGGRMDVLYSPDAFGHPAILPTLAREFGIDTAVVWRGLAPPSGIDRDLYRWSGPDGAEVLVYHLPRQGYEIGADLDAPRESLASRWRELRPQLVGRSTTSHVAVFVGADHHAPALDPAGICRNLAALELQHEVRLSTLPRFFAAAGPEASNLAPLQGELRWSYGHTWTLQGTFATRARLKRRHGAVELYMQRMAEPLAALENWHCSADRRGLLRQATRTLAKCQFHDTLCGCSSDDVAREQATRLTTITASAREIARSALHGLARHAPDTARDGATATSPTLLVWNPEATTRGGIVTAEITWFRRDVLVGPPSGRVPQVGPDVSPFMLMSVDDVPIPVQILSVRHGHERIDAHRHYPDQDEVDRILIAFDAPPIWGLGAIGLTVTRASATPADRSLRVRENSLVNQFVEVHVDGDGRITMVDRRSGERFARILQLVDEGDAGDTYTPQPGRGTSNMQAGRPRILAAGPLVGALELQFSMPSATSGHLVGRLVLTLHADSAVLRVRLEVDNAAVNHRLRFCVPLGVGNVVTAGAAFGGTRREVPTIDGARFEAETPVPTAPAHRYVAAGAGERALAILAPGFMEYEWNSHHDFMVTVLRSVGELSRNTLAGRPGHAGWPMATPEAQEAGTHVMELGVAPLSALDVDDPAMLEQLWGSVFAAPQPLFVRDFAGGLDALTAIGVRLEGRGLVFSALKQSEDGSGLVIRCYNAGSATVNGRWILRSPARSATLLRADETFVRELPLPDRHSIAFTAAPHALVTILIIPEYA